MKPPWASLAQTSLAPSRSWMAALWTTTTSTNPSVSTARWRLRPVTFFPASSPHPAPIGRLDRLAVDDRGTRRRGAPGLHPHPLAQQRMQPLPGAVPAPRGEVVVDRLVRWEVVRQRPPGPASTQVVQDAVENLAHIHRARPPTGLGWGDQRLQDRPLRVREVTRVRLVWHLLRSNGYTLPTPRSSSVEYTLSRHPLSSTLAFRHHDPVSVLAKGTGVGGAFMHVGCASRYA